MKLRVGGIRKKLLALGFDISEERIRNYEKLGLYKSKRNPTNEYREYSEDSIDNIIKTIMLIDLGTPIKAFLENDRALIDYRKEVIKRALDTLLNDSSQ